MTYEEALSYVHANTWTKHAPGLDRIRRLCARLGHPQKHLRFIHVAGTNGKGSTCAMTAAILRAAGYRVGLFTSPYIVRFNERMQIDGTPISDGELAELTERIRPFADGMEETPTEFELITAIGLVYFARHACDFVVFEAGMGGRLDSTNVIEATETVISVITGIAMDHTAYLGDTPEKIAAEKAGIIKKGRPVVFGGAHEPVGVGKDGRTGDVRVDPASCASVISARAKEMEAPYVPVDAEALTLTHTDLYGSDFDFGGLKGLHVPLAGLYQPYNAATALTVISLLAKEGVTIPEEAIREGLSSVSWPGRFEILCRDPLVISDGGHNPEGIDAAVATAKACFGGRRIFILSGVMADKDYAHMVNRMSEIAARVFTVTPGNSRALNGGAYAALFAENGLQAESFPAVADALSAAMEAAKETDTPVLCLGSLYMYAELKAALEG